MGWNWNKQSGNDHPANNPAFTYYLFGEYSFPPFDFGQLSSRLEFQYQARNFTTSGGSCVDTDPGPGQNIQCGPSLIVSPLGLMNGRIALDLPRYSTEVALIGTNLLNRTYDTAGVDFGAAGFGYHTRYWGTPRT